MGTIAKVSAGGSTHYIASTTYCYCSTAADTAAKTATVIGDQADNAATAAFTLIKGTTVHVKFVNTNTAANATLAIGGTTALPLCCYGTTRVGTTTSNSWTAGSIVSLTYDGTSWVMNDYIANTNTNNAVTQTITSTTDADYRMLFSVTADDTTRTEGARKDTDLTYNPSINSLKVGNIRITETTIQTGSNKRQKISFETLFTWLMTTQKYIPSGVDCRVTLGTTWSYANNDILQFTANGVNYELDLAGVLIEFIGKATAYNLGRFRFIIHANPSPSFTATSGYTQFPASSIAEYWSNGSSATSLYNPVWKVYFGTAVSVGSASGWSAGSTPTLGTAFSVKAVNAFTANTPTAVTPATVVTGGSTTAIPNISKKTVVTGVTKKTVVTGGSTTNIPNITKKTVVTGGSTTAVPNISKKTVVTGVTKKTVVTSASGATAAISKGLLTLTDGSFSTGDSCTVTTGDSVTVGTAINAYTSLTTGSACTVTAGTAASLTTTTHTIPNVTGVGTKPSLTVTSTRVAGA